MAHDMYPLKRPPLSPELILRAYASGIFPMADSADDPDLFWVDPRRRGIFPLDGVHVSRSLRRRIRKGDFEIRVNSAFSDVLDGCADRDVTWINAELCAVYQALHHVGHAHSVEVWEENTLAGGVFGITLGGAYFGESMFSRRRDASKIALVWLIARLRAGGFTLFDTQFVTDHLTTLGAVEIPRAEYRRRLSSALAKDGDFLRMPEDLPPHSVVQLSTQTS